MYGANLRERDVVRRGVVWCGVVRWCEQRSVEAKPYHCAGGTVLCKAKCISSSSTW